MLLRKDPKPWSPRSPADRSTSSALPAAPRSRSRKTIPQLSPRSPSTRLVRRSQHRLLLPHWLHSWTIPRGRSEFTDRIVGRRSLDSTKTSQLRVMALHAAAPEYGPFPERG